jgi:hypothetical protein
MKEMRTIDEAWKKELDTHLYIDKIKWTEFTKSRPSESRNCRMMDFGEQHT